MAASERWHQALPLVPKEKEGKEGKGARLRLNPVGGFAGTVGNYAGLGAALANVRSGLPVSSALRTADRIGEASTVLIGTADNAAQFSPNFDPCTCKK